VGIKTVRKMDFYKDKYLFLTLSIISCIFVHDFRLESSSVIIGVTGLSAAPLFCKARRFDVDST
jgi:hypothetical protein